MPPTLSDSFDPPAPDLCEGDVVAYTDKFLKWCRHGEEDLFGQVVRVKRWKNGDWYLVVKFSDGETRECHADNVCRVGLRCVSCGSPYHPSTGHVLSRKSVQCGPCARNFVKWLSGHLKRKWSGSSFYEEALTSIRPDF